MLSIIKNLPTYAQDIKENLDKIFCKKPNTFLTEEELYSISLALGYYLQEESLLKAIRAEAKLILGDKDATASKMAAVLMSMNNSFYNFKEMIEDDEIEQMESGLKMEGLKLPEKKKIFEMSCLAISIVNKCHYCIKVHKNKLLNKGVTKEIIVEIARVASVLLALKTTLIIESQRSYDFLVRKSFNDDLEE
jgi:alkyl hydroperoxide reductase subunit D